MDSEGGKGEASSFLCLGKGKSTLAVAGGVIQHKRHKTKWGEPLLSTVLRGSVATRQKPIKQKLLRKGAEDSREFKRTLRELKKVQRGMLCYKGLPVLGQGNWETEKSQNFPKQPKGRGKNLVRGGSFAGWRGGGEERVAIK